MTLNWHNVGVKKLAALVPEHLTDCIKDRLAAYFFWKDQQSLDQAVMVAKRNKIYLSEIKRWAEGQGELEKYDYFVKKMK